MKKIIKKLTQIFILGVFALLLTNPINCMESEEQNSESPSECRGNFKEFKCFFDEKFKEETINANYTKNALDDDSYKNFLIILKSFYLDSTTIPEPFREVVKSTDNTIKTFYNIHVLNGDTMSTSNAINSLVYFLSSFKMHKTYLTNWFLFLLQFLKTNEVVARELSENIFFRKTLVSDNLPEIKKIISDYLQCNKPLEDLFSCFTELDDGEIYSIANSKNLNNLVHNQQSINNVNIQEEILNLPATSVYKQIFNNSIKKLQQQQGGETKKNPLLLKNFDVSDISNNKQSNNKITTKTTNWKIFIRWLCFITILVIMFDLLSGYSAYSNKTDFYIKNCFASQDGSAESRLCNRDFNGLGTISSNNKLMLFEFLKNIFIKK